MIKLLTEHSRDFSNKTGNYLLTKTTKNKIVNKILVYNEFLKFEKLKSDGSKEILNTKNYDYFIKDFDPIVAIEKSNPTTQNSIRRTFTRKAGTSKPKSLLEILLLNEKQNISFKFRQCNNSVQSNLPQMPQEESSKFIQDFDVEKFCIDFCNFGKRILKLIQKS